MKTVAEAMTPLPEALDPDAGIRRAAQMMRDGDYGVVPLVDDQGVLVGVVTDRDIVVRAVAEGRDADTPVRHCMTDDPDTVAQDTPLEQAMTVMTARQVRRLPVVENGRLVGMLSLADIAVSAAPPDAKAQVVESVSAGAGGDLSESTQTRLRNA
ncbi:MAG: CBS domain-containing protein [Armatimonadetes bacterium]|nr:CBS domain-containing protein [Armatimonadota bacterium]